GPAARVDPSHTLFRQPARLSRMTSPTAVLDVHSYANPGQVRVRHVELDLDVDFERRILSGTATLHLDRPDSLARRLVLDTRGLDVARAEAGRGEAWSTAAHELGVPDPILGTPLSVALEPGDDRVRIAYATRPGAS